MENLIERGRPHMARWRMCIACWITKAAHTLTIYNTYWFTIATMVARTRLSITLYVHCIVVNAEEAKPTVPFAMV